MATVTSGRATDFITFSRPGATGGGATVTDRDGKIKWAGHNLLTNSESFDTASYGTVGLLAFGSGSSANSTAAPNGTTTADYIRETNANSRHFIFANPTTIAGANYTARVFVKAAERTFVALGIRTTDGVTGYAAAFNLSTGAMTATSSTGTPTNTSAPTPVAVGSGWYLLSVSMDATTSSAYVEIGLSDSATPTFAAGMPTYTGTGTSGLYVWGAHLYRSDLGGMVLNPARGDAYYPTSVRNMLGWTEDFSNAAWTKASATVTSNQGIAPNGLETADKLDAGSAAAVSQINIPVVANTPYTFSVWIRGVSSSGTTEIHFSKAAASPENTTAVNFTTSWQRFTVTGSITSTLGYAQIGTWASRASGPSADILIWGAQLSDSASLDAYSPVYGAAVTSAAYYAPRLDFDPVTLAARGLLVEEQRTNLVLNSADFTLWSVANTTITANQVVAPDGTQTADTFAASTTGTFRYVYQAPTLTQNVTYTFSAYFKTKTARWVWLLGETSGDAFASFDIQNGVVGAVAAGLTSSITHVGNGWYRCVITFTVTSATGVQQIGFGLSDSNTVSNPSATAGIDAYVWGAQLEANASFATSYIPNGSAVAGATRTADVASVSTQAFPYLQGEGTMVASVRLPNVNQVAIISVFNTTAFYNSITLAKDNGIATGAGNVLTAGMYDGNSTVLALASTGNDGAVHKVGMTWSSSGVSGVADGGTVQSGTYRNVQPSILRLGGRDDGLQINGWLRQITYIPRRLSNSELQARTV